VELPLRDAGYLLPTWRELRDFSSACRAREVPLHFDGARIWESQPYLGSQPAEIADLADTIYVSFYKGLRGLAGAAVAGAVGRGRRGSPMAHSAWRHHHDPAAHTSLAAIERLRDELPMMAQYHQPRRRPGGGDDRARPASAPEPPHTNAFRVLVAEDSATVNQRLVTYMQENRSG
jgi:hypothetical protein